MLSSDGKVVPVKCYLEGKGKLFEKTFAAELAAVAHLCRKNLVPLRGWFVFEDQIYLVYDYITCLTTQSWQNPIEGRASWLVKAWENCKRFV